MSTTAEENFFRRKYNSPIAFAVGILLFLLPFVEVKCNGITMAKNTGVGLAIGSDYQLGNEMKSLKNSFPESKETSKGPSKESGKVYAFALAALLLGVAGLVLSLTNPDKSWINTAIGVLAFISMLVLMIQLNSDLKTKAGSNNDDEFSKSVKITVSYTLWYYLSMISFLAAAFLSFKRGRVQTDNTHVPPNAPQLNLEHPGDQSEFPKSASESQLG